MRIKTDDSVLLVIDIQERLFPHIYEHDVLEKNCQILISGMKILELPILITEQYTKGLGPTIQSVKEMLADHKPLEKISFSCCDDPLFLKSLKKLKKNNIILCGIEAHVCVLQTALDLSHMGYHVVLIEDCISSRKVNDKRIAVKRMHQDGMIVTTHESILFELCQVAGTEQFRAISKLVK